MGDLPTEHGSNMPLEHTGAGLPQEDSQSLTKHVSGQPNYHNSQPRPTGNEAPFFSQYSNLPQTQSTLDPRRAQMPQNPSHYNIPGQNLSNSSFNMSAMAGALPSYQTMPSGQGYHPQQQSAPRGLSGASTPAVVYQLQQISQYPGQAAAYSNQAAMVSPVGQGQYPASQLAPRGGQSGQIPAYGSYNQPQPNVMSPMQQQFPQQSSYYYYPSPYDQQSQYGPGFQTQPGNTGPYARRSSFQGAQGFLPPHGGNIAAMGSHYPQAGQIAAGGAGYGEMGGYPGYSTGDSPHLVRRQSSDTSLGSVPRGPPRKPKQSGHALWVGNLPPGTTVVDLKDHFSRDATKDIESLFLISKSNCAFVNYRSEDSCAAAMQRFHDSRFNGVRLVCRLRRSSAPASGVPTGPASMTGQQNLPASPQKSPALSEDETKDVDQPESTKEEAAESTATELSKVPEKFFIVKSLTLQDLEQSVRNGMWATQSHNEDTFNKAYESTENVYLIFSANKSGEYFGYARMTSPILEDAAQITSTVPKTEVSEPSDAPKSIPTLATAHAPKGRIIDDSARGTIFWEADRTDSEDEEGKEEKTEEAAEGQTWGKPFKIEWVSTQRLPFYRTRGLRNPWNANREVKIARDGTELETQVGKRLIQMFHRLAPPPTGNSSLPTGHLAP